LKSVENPEVQLRFEGPDVNTKSIKWLMDCIHEHSMSSISSWDQIHIPSNINPIHKMTVNFSRAFSHN
jgi:hypothetical protein